MHGFWRTGFAVAAFSVAAVTALILLEVFAQRLGSPPGRGAEVVLFLLLYTAVGMGAFDLFRPPAKLYPELLLLEDKSHRREVFSSCYRRLWRTLPIALYPPALAVAAMAACVFLDAQIGRAVGLTPYATGAVFGATSGLICALGAPLVARGFLRAGIRRTLAERAIPICTNCGYHLTGNVSGVCPECGTATPKTATRKHGAG